VATCSCWGTWASHRSWEVGIWVLWIGIANGRGSSWTAGVECFFLVMLMYVAHQLDSSNQFNQANDEDLYVAWVNAMFGNFKPMVFCKISVYSCFMHLFDDTCETSIAFYVPARDCFLYLYARYLVRLRLVLSRRLATQSCPSNESSASVSSELAWMQRPAESNCSEKVWHSVHRKMLPCNLRWA
jgi:hypothetical protein